MNREDATKLRQRLDPRLVVTLVEPSTTYTACPFSNEVIGGIRELRDQEFTMTKWLATASSWPSWR